MIKDRDTPTISYDRIQWGVECPLTGKKCNSMCASYSGPISDDVTGPWSVNLCNSPIVTGLIWLGED